LLNLAFILGFKPHTHKLYILGHCTNTVGIISLPAKRSCELLPSRGICRSSSVFTFESSLKLLVQMTRNLVENIYANFVPIIEQTWPP